MTTGSWKVDGTFWNAPDALGCFPAEYDRSKAPAVWVPPNDGDRLKARLAAGFSKYRAAAACRPFGLFAATPIADPRCPFGVARAGSAPCLSHASGSPAGGVRRRSHRPLDNVQMIV